MNMTHINFSTGRFSRAVLCIAPDGQAWLDRTLPISEQITRGVWRGYWPIDNATRDRLLRSNAVQRAIRSNAAYAAWMQAVEVHGFGNGIARAVADAVFSTGGQP